MSDNDHDQDLVVVDDGTIVVVAKCPIKGKSKTRLIPLLGEQGSVDLALAMLSDVLLTLEHCANLRNVRKVLLYAPGNEEGLAIMKEILTNLQLSHERVTSIQEKENEGEGVSAHPWTLVPMMEGDLRSSDLGAKLKDALNRVRSSDGGKSGVAFLGMDSPILSLDDIVLGLLNAKTVPPTAMLCPADDGGYGMLCVPPNANASKTFCNMCWSHALTALSQIKTLTDQGIMVKIGKCMHDIDEPSDVQALSQRLSGALFQQGKGINLHQNSGDLAIHAASQHPSCQHTREFLKAAGLLQ